MAADYNLYALSNGIRIVHKQVDNTKIVHCGFILDIGSRDETPDQQGIAHFWEHMAFKGTKKRKAFHILNRLDSVGGELNAYTTKEKVCFYASVLENHFENAVELLSDITFNSSFPEKQIERERSVILEEMSLYHDSPEDAIQDQFDYQVFHGHPLGFNILGAPETVNSFKREDFLAFVKNHLDTERIIFSCVGNIPLKKVIKLAEKHLKEVPVIKAVQKRLLFQGYQPSHEVVKRSITQAHCAIGRTTYPIGDPNRLLFIMLVNILGGPAMNTRLNLALREKRGFVYSIDANYTPYTETGLFSILFATEPGRLEKSMKLVMKELDMLKKKPLGSLQLHYAKEQFIGQLAMAEENNASLMLMMGKSILDLERIESLEEIFYKIKKIEAKELQDIANEVFDERQLSSLIFKPEA